MADSPLHSLASLHSSATSFGSDSRPASRAQSDASFVTTRPGSSTTVRSISHEIDHIKTLISRSTDPPRTASGSISAQVFRPRSSSISVVVTQAHVFHELDNLKRRIKQEQQQQQQQTPQLTRRTSQIDPGQESDSDQDDICDEREVELERAREDVIVVRQRLDGLLETAERKIDRLMADKQMLESACQQRREGLVVAAVERRNLTHALDEAQTRIEQLTKELQQLQKEQQVQLSELHGNKVEAEDANEELRERLILLQSRHAELEMDLSTAQDVASKNLEQLGKLSEECTTSETLSKNTIASLQQRIDQEVAKSERHGNVTEDLRSQLAKTEAQNREQCVLLRTQIDDGKRLLRDALQEVSTSHAALQEITHGRDQLASQIDKYQVELEAAVSQKALIEGQLSGAQMEHEEQTRMLRESHEKLVAELESSIESIHARLQERDQSQNLAVEEMARQHEEALKELSVSYQSEVEQIRLEGLRSAGDLEDHHARKTIELNARHDQALKALKASHESEKDRVRQEAVRESEADHAKFVQDTAAQHSRIVEELKASHQVEIAQIHLETASQLKDSVGFHAKVNNELQSKHQEVLKQARHDNERLSEQFKRDIAQKDKDLVEQQQLHRVALQNLEEAGRKSASERAEGQERRETQLLATLQEARDRAELSLRELRDVHVLEQQRSTSDHQASLEAARQEAAERHELLIDAIRKEESDHRSKMAGAHAEVLSGLESQLAKLRSKHQEALATIQEEHDTDALERSARHALELQTTQAKMQERIDDLRAAHDATLAATQAKHDQAIHELQISHSDSVQAADERENTLRMSHEAELADRDGQHRQMIAQLQAVHQEEEKVASSALHNAEEGRKSLETSLAAALAKHDEKIGQLEEEHRIELVNERNRVQKAIADAAVTHRSALESVTAENQSAVSRLQAELSSTRRELQELRTQSAEDTARVEIDNRIRVDKIEAEWAQKAEEAMKIHKADLQKAADEAARNLDAATKHFRDQLRERETAEASRIAAFHNAHAQEATCIRENAKTERESVEAEFNATKERLLAEHGGNIARLRSEYESQLEETRLDHKVRIDVVSEKLRLAELKMKNAIEDHERLTTELQTTHVADIHRLTSKHDQDTRDLQDKKRAEMEILRKDSVEVLSRVTAIEAGYDAQIEDLKFSHDAELTILKNEVAAYIEDIKTRSQEANVMKREIESLQNRLEEARFEAEERFLASEKQHKAALDAAVEKTRQNGQAELRNLKKRHQDAISQVRAIAQKQAANQLSDLENFHQQEFSSFRKSTHEAYQGDIMRLETEHQTSLAELESRLKDEREAELASKQAIYHSEMTALQARVDASLTGQAEAERAVALLRQQVAKTDRRSLESKASAEDQVATLQMENADLSKQLTLVQSSLRDSQKKGGSGSSSPTSEQGHGELASLKLQLGNFEEERLAMHRTLEKRSAEKLELARQNDFLVKELDVLLAQRSRNKEANSGMVDAVVQTESFISEPKVDLSSVQLLKAESRISLAPLSPGQRQAKDEVEMAWTTRSFEDYLDNARSELTQLGSVISANESLFAKKISEHVGELQRAKDQLAADYDARITNLAADKEKMEVMILSKQQAAFAKDRKDLVASYTDGSTDALTAADTPDRKAVALRAAEARLVADYNKRMFRRKSQIALKHAEEFQALTRDYDRKVADLLDNKSRLEGDLSIDPTQFEQDMGELQTQSARLAERSGGTISQRYVRASPSPNSSTQILESPPVRRRSPTSPAEGDRSRQVFRTSTPRTSLSIPRSSHSRSPLPKDRNGLHKALSSPRGSEKYPPVPQLSLMRVKTPSDVHSIAARAASSPLMNASPVPLPQSPTLRCVSQQISPQPPVRPSDRVQGETAHDLSIKPSDFEQRQVHPHSSYVEGAVELSVPEPSKPGFLRRVVDKISSDSSRPGSSSSTPSTTASKLGHRAHYKSTKLSSGMIYYQAPKRSPSPKAYDH